ncbi:SH3 domain-containing protein [Azospirillum sp.]|uniref:SH3 domain-containing protein n=1 Tax=Azospirillum sp. TaxID=34012 RepID=UPI002D2202C2|nr:SH3 domain-containing protein [Azospirillum sp.]HYD70151.1 SH3 domain-containing protein [Azospirillum sp.]
MLSGIRLALAVVALAAGLSAGPTPAAAAEGGGKDKGPLKTTGLPLPRFVTLRSGEVNVRTGPATTYPVEWVFVRKEMPVEITQEFDTWRRIRDWEGAEGWVHQSMLSGKRTVVVMGDVRSIRREPSPAAPAVARAQPGVMGWLHKCQGEWCQVDLKGYKGWMLRSEVWGVYANEKFE